MADGRDPSDLHEAPGVEREERERHHFERGNGRGQGHVELALTVEIPMMSRADEAAAEDENHVQINRPERRRAGHQIEFIEADGDYHGYEELEEALGP